MKYVMPALRLKLFMLVLLGLIYPFAMTGLSQALFPARASGDLVTVGTQVVGARLMAQKFEKPQYFWPRPSAVDYNPLSSGGSNLGPTSADLQKQVTERRLKWVAADGGEPPQELLFTSGSGLDPHLSVAAAKYQAPRVAKLRNINVEIVQDLIDKLTERRSFIIFGEPKVNVLTLNMALDNEHALKESH